LLNHTTCDGWRGPEVVGSIIAVDVEYTPCAQIISLHTMATLAKEAGALGLLYVGREPSGAACYQRRNTYENYDTVGSIFVGEIPLALEQYMTIRNIVTSGQQINVTVIANSTPVPEHQFSQDSIMYELSFTRNVVTVTNSWIVVGGNDAWISIQILVASVAFAAMLGGIIRAIQFLRVSKHSSIILACLAFHVLADLGSFFQFIHFRFSALPIKA
jgi:hypothetical protein